MPDQVRIDVPPPLDRAYLTIVRDGSDIAQAAFEPVELDELIANLGTARAHLREEVPREMEPNQRSTGVPDPIWLVREGVALPFEGKALFLRSPMLGWLSFALPTHEAQAMSEALVKRHD